jgi:hypothetical protein
MSVPPPDGCTATAGIASGYETSSPTYFAISIANATSDGRGEILSYALSLTMVRFSFSSSYFFNFPNDVEEGNAADDSTVPSAADRFMSVFLPNGGLGW